LEVFISIKAPDLAVAPLLLGSTLFLTTLFWAKIKLPIKQK
jgi:uncharacterized MnhB-related membrane protein